MFSFFKKKESPKAVEPIQKIKVDMHSHLLPGIDDGAGNIEQSLFLIRRFIDLGYKKLITTPHVMSDFYRNTPEIILGKLEEVRAAIKVEGLDIQIEAAAEYYLDEFLIEKLENNEPLLTIGGKYLLFETSFINPCSQLLHAVFLMRSSGYIPVLAHPERYTYYFPKYNDLLSLIDKGVKFQLNISSLTGYYSKQSKKIAEKLIKDKAISFLGTDCHAPKHLDQFKKAEILPTFHEALKLDLLNNSLLD